MSPDGQVVRYPLRHACGHWVVEALRHESDLIEYGLAPRPVEPNRVWIIEQRQSVQLVCPSEASESNTPTTS
ncbi:hypothetical protein GCM10027600_37190 [Nocardioides ginsengisegetis]